METKKCTKCGQERESKWFYKQKGTKDGLRTWCKSCFDGATIRWVKKNKKRWLEIMAKTRLKNKERNKLKRKIWEQENPEILKARRFIPHAVRDGRLDRGNCEVCDKSNAEGHHDDYSEPKDVRWLCKKHHAEHHKAEKLAKFYYGELL